MSHQNKLKVLQNFSCSQHHKQTFFVKIVLKTIGGLVKSFSNIDFISWIEKERLGIFLNNLNKFTATF